MHFFYNYIVISLLIYKCCWFSGWNNSFERIALISFKEVIYKILNLIKFVLILFLYIVIQNKAFI